MPRQKRQHSSALNHTLVGRSAPFATPNADKGPNGELILPNEEDRAAALVDLALALIDSAIEILEQHVKRDEQLRKASVLMPGGSVGKHFRHVRYSWFQWPYPQGSPFDAGQQRRGWRHHGPGLGRIIHLAWDSWIRNHPHCDPSSIFTSRAIES